METLSALYVAMRAAPPLSRSALSIEQRALVHSTISHDEWFGTWPSDAINSLADEAKISTFFDGQLIYAAGDPCLSALVVLSGVIEIGWTAADGRHIVHHYLSSGRIINLVPMLDQQGLGHDYRAHGTTVIATISREVLLAWFEREPHLMRSVIGLLCQRSRNLYQEIRHHNLSTLRTRLAHQLMFLAKYHGNLSSQASEGGLEIGIKLSQENLAGLLASSRQSINKELSWLAEQQIISVKYNRVLILDPEGLEKLSR